MRDLSGKTAIVTGAGSGIGAAIAVELAAKGMDVWLVGRNPKALDVTASRCRGNGRTITFPADITDASNVDALAARLSEDGGGDVLVHSAGAIALGSMPELSERELDGQYRINIRAPYMVTRALLPLIVSAHGQIVFVNSSAGVQQARAEQGQYAATKHGLRAVADSLRDEINAKGVRVLSVYPGRTATPMQEAIHRSEGLAYNPEELLQAEDIAHMVIAALTLPDTGEVTDIHIRPRRKRVQT